MMWYSPLRVPSYARHLRSSSCGSPNTCASSCAIVNEVLSPLSSTIEQLRNGSQMVPTSARPTREHDDVRAGVYKRTVPSVFYIDLYSPSVTQLRRVWQMSFLKNNTKTNRTVWYRNSKKKYNS